MVKLGEMGMDVARLNFSHGTYAEHAKLFQHLTQAGKKLGKPFGILQDLQGPKIRVGDIAKAGIKLEVDAEAVFTTEKKTRVGDIPVTLPELHRDVKKGERMLFDDGLLEVEVTRVVGRRIHTRVIEGGLLLPHKGLNLPGTKLHIPALSKKDRADALFGVKLGVDFVALSFVRSPDDVKELRQLLNRAGENGKRIHIIAKIEKGEAVERFGEILPLCDAIMVARGDLGIETPADTVPVVQKQLIDACRERGTPVIVATQMLDSMQRNARATRAEVSDVANAVADHADAVMLSGETASGKFPIESVKIMAETIRTMEASVYDNVNPFGVHMPTDAAHALCLAARTLVDTMNIQTVTVQDESLTLARRLSSFRPETRILAAVPDAHLGRLLRLVWGVEAEVLRSGDLAQTLLKKAGIHRALHQPVLSIYSDKKGLGMELWA